MRVITKKVGGELEVKEVKKIDLDFLHECVGGYIEFARYGDFARRGIDICLNEEGKLIDLEPNIYITYKNELVDVLVGDLVFLKHDDEGNSIGLDLDDIEFINHYLSNRRALIGKSEELASLYSVIDCE